MTITTQLSQFGGIETPDDKSPGTLDVRWAEEALRAVNSDPPSPPRRLRARRRPRRGLRRVLAAVAIAGCLVVAILVAPSDTSPVPPSTPAPAATTTRPHPAATTIPKSIVSSVPFPCLLDQPNRQDAIERFALIPGLSCVSASLGEQPSAATRSGG